MQLNINSNWPGLMLLLDVIESQKGHANRSNFLIAGVRITKVLIRLSFTFILHRKSFSGEMFPLFPASVWKLKNNRMKFSSDLFLFIFVKLLLSPPSPLASFNVMDMKDH